MKKFDQWYFPDHEKHLPDWMQKKGDKWNGRLAYQGAKIRRALELCPPDRRRTAIDIGGHVGLWSYYLSSAFTNVVAYEPIDEHRACFKENVTADNVLLCSYALGDEEGYVGMHTEPSSSGDTYVKGKGTTPVRRLDDVGLLCAVDVDLIKADCEGYEYFALHGAEQIIIRDRPVIVVEQKPGKAQKFGLSEQHAVEYLTALGMKLHSEIGGDFFMIWR